MGLTTSPVSSVGGAQAQLPVWMFDSGGGVPDSGCFTADDPTVGGTHTITLSTFDKSGEQWLPAFTGAERMIPCHMIFTDGSGKPVMMNMQTASSDGGGNIVVSCTPSIYLNTDSWIEGDYKMSFSPYPQNLARILDFSSIIPIADGTYPFSATLGGSFTTVSGITVSTTPGS